MLSQITQKCRCDQYPDPTPVRGIHNALGHNNLYALSTDSHKTLSVKHANILFTSNSCKFLQVFNCTCAHSNNVPTDQCTVQLVPRKVQAITTQARSIGKQHSSNSKTNFTRMHPTCNLAYCLIYRPNFTFTTDYDQTL